MNFAKTQIIIRDSRVLINIQVLKKLFPQMNFFCILRSEGK